MSFRSGTVKDFSGFDNKDISPKTIRTIDTCTDYLTVKKNAIIQNLDADSINASQLTVNGQLTTTSTTTIDLNGLIQINDTVYVLTIEEFEEQLAQAAIEGGKSIIVAPGLFLVSSELKIPPNTDIKGSGFNTTIFRARSGFGASPNAMFNICSDNVSLSDIKIDGRNEGPTLVKIDTANNVDIANIKFDNTAGYMIYSESSNRVTVRNCFYTRKRSGANSVIYIDSSTNINVEGGTISDVVKTGTTAGDDIGTVLTLDTRTSNTETVIFQNYILDGIQTSRGIISADLGSAGSKIDTFKVLNVDFLNIEHVNPAVEFDNNLTSGVTRDFLIDGCVFRNTNSTALGFENSETIKATSLDIVHSANNTVVMGNCENTIFEKCEMTGNVVFDCETLTNFTLANSVIKSNAGQNFVMNRITYNIFGGLDFVSSNVSENIKILGTTFEGFENRSNLQVDITTFRASPRLGELCAIASANNVIIQGCTFNNRNPVDIGFSAAIGSLVTNKIVISNSILNTSNTVIYTLNTNDFIINACNFTSNEFNTFGMIRSEGTAGLNVSSSRFTANTVSVSNDSPPPLINVQPTGLPGIPIFTGGFNFNGCIFEGSGEISANCLRSTYIEGTDIRFTNCTFQLGSMLDLNLAATSRITDISFVDCDITGTSNVHSVFHIKDPESTLDQETRGLKFASCEIQSNTAPFLFNLRRTNDSSFTGCTFLSPNTMFSLNLCRNFVWSDCNFGPATVIDSEEKNGLNVPGTRIFDLQACINFDIVDSSLVAQQSVRSRPTITTPTENIISKHLRFSGCTLTTTQYASDIGVPAINDIIGSQFRPNTLPLFDIDGMSYLKIESSQLYLGNTLILANSIENVSINHCELTYWANTGYALDFTNISNCIVESSTIGHGLADINGINSSGFGLLNIGGISRNNAVVANSCFGLSFLNTNFIGQDSSDSVLTYSGTSSDLEGILLDIYDTDRVIIKGCDFQQSNVNIKSNLVENMIMDGNRINDSGNVRIDANCLIFTNNIFDSGDLALSGNNVIITQNMFKNTPNNFTGTTGAVVVANNIKF